ncbi:multiple epidermal growth factor-like domains protein 10 isoform X1 [Carassius auratus]|uniref:Multiple epidermal growth factor-like domains protein 10 isoform X1 n=1 Tax=Carassius auratus TaxID=7957 RepID=A0A6P6KZ60_CARAU|nr:multiple epidermal growth factor-like domains protein 10 isoform X1 [Carassius auratus]
MSVPECPAGSFAACVKTRRHVTMWAELVPVRLAGRERSVKNVSLFLHLTYINISHMCVCVCVCVCPACPQGFYGLDCQQKCVCMNGALCDHVRGECVCPPGCNQSFYGPGCERRCQCLNGGARLSVSGACECPAGFIGALCHLSESHTAHVQDTLCMCLIPCAPAGRYGPDCARVAVCGKGVTGVCVGDEGELVFGEVSVCVV